jgi:hypothetical protein
MKEIRKRIPAAFSFDHTAFHIVASPHDRSNYNKPVACGYNSVSL